MRPYDFISIPTIHSLVTMNDMCMSKFTEFTNNLQWRIQRGLQGFHGTPLLADVSYNRKFIEV